MNKRYKILSLLALTALSTRAQDISQIAKSDPLVITGAVGTQNTYYHSSVGDGYASPLSNSVYANLNISLYGLTMPFTLYYSNDNLDFNYPHFSFNLTPRYKSWTGHLGRSSMAFSSYVMNMSFNGVGLEYNDGSWRFGGFYGVLRSAVNDDPADPLARNPQYKRVGWGFKVGYGSSRNYIDLYLLKASDRLKSLDEHWQQRVSPQENLVVGIKGNVSPTRFLSLTVNAAASALTTDTRDEAVENDKVERWDKVFTARTSSMARFAGDASVNLTLPGVSGSVFYRIVQPDYTSMGTYYMANNYQGLGVNLSTFLLNRISLSGSFSSQADNLTNKQLYTTRGMVYAANASARVTQNLNVALGYNGYTQRQSDGTAKVNDTTRVDRSLQSFTVTPSYLIDGSVLSHSISLSASYTENKNRNSFASGESDVKSFALGLSYGLGVKPWAIDFVGSLSHQQSNGYGTKYYSDVASLSASRSFFEEKNLNVSATVSACYNEVEYTSKSLSMGFDAAVSYTLAKAHAFSLSASMYKYGDVNVTKTRSGLDVTDITASLNYTYTFSLIEIKRRTRNIEH